MGENGELFWGGIAVEGGLKLEGKSGRGPVGSGGGYAVS